MDSLYIYGYAPVVLLVAVGYLATILLRIGTRPKGLPPGPATELIWGILKQVRPLPTDHDAARLPYTRQVIQK